MQLVSSSGRQIYDKRQSAGFSLLEVLIALVLLSIGLLGLAGLETASLKNNDSAMVRSQAVTLGYSILDKIRANRAAALDGDYATGFGEGSSDITDTTVAAQDLKAWKQDVEMLPGGQGRIAKNDDNYFTVEVRWNESKSLNNPDDQDTGPRIVTLKTKL